MRNLVWYLMDTACHLTGHRLFGCYNGRLNRLWYWANGPFTD